ncbi:MAG: esterase, partial [Flavobacteriales bacterium]|nr:esterase [Flavobacteriales bacterium]
MTQSTKSFVEVPRTARYYKLNTATQKTKNIWIVFHGYGQLAEYFIKHFEDLDADENFIIAPEGLSRFYVDGLAGRVGASWMTKEDREEEIKDQSNYINAVLKDVGVDPSNTSYRFIVLGFSQGTAAAVRWLANNGIRPSQLVLWAGSFPHDVDAIEKSDIFKNLPVHFVYGDEDQFLKDVNIEEKTAEF